MLAKPPDIHKYINFKLSCHHAFVTVKSVQQNKSACIFAVNALKKLFFYERI